MICFHDSQHDSIDLSSIENQRVVHMSERAEAKKSSILGLETDELAGLSADDLNNNPIAVRMLLHYYRQISDENVALKNTNNTLETYVDAYENQRDDSLVSAVLLALSNILIGFGVNLLTAGNGWPGGVLLVGGVLTLAAGLYFAFRNRKL